MMGDEGVGTGKKTGRMNAQNNKKRYIIRVRLPPLGLSHLCALGKDGEARRPPRPCPFRVGIAPGQKGRLTNTCVVQLPPPALERAPRPAERTRDPCRLVSGSR